MTSLGVKARWLTCSISLSMSTLRNIVSQNSGIPLGFSSAVPSSSAFFSSMEAFFCNSSWKEQSGSDYKITSLSADHMNMGTVLVDQVIRSFTVIWGGKSKTESCLSFVLLKNKNRSLFSKHLCVWFGGTITTALIRHHNAKLWWWGCLFTLTSLANLIVKAMKDWI